MRIVLLAAAFGLAFAAPVAAAPKVLTPLQQYERMCANVLNFTPRIVRREAVAAIAPGSHIVIHAICRGVPLHDFGNAAGLRRTIAANHTLVSALALRGWRPDDVIAISIHGDTVDLYVHRG